MFSWKIILFGFDTLYRILVGILPALEGHCQYRNEADQQEGNDEYPSMDWGLVRKTFQPVMPNPPAERSCQQEADHQHDEITLGKHIKNFTGRASQDFPDTDFLAAVFTFEQRKTEYTNYAEHDGD